MFWVEYYAQYGISGQKFSSSGERLWGNNGITFVPLSISYLLNNLRTHMGDGRAYVFYFENNPLGSNTIIRGFACDANGSFVWPGNIVTLSNPTSQKKLQLVTALDVYKNCKLVWGDRRIDIGGIYAQDINPSGQLGKPVTPVELVSFTASVIENYVTLKWIPATETNNQRFEVERKTAPLNLPQGETSGEWKVTGLVNGYGTTTEPKSYSFIDDRLVPGKYSYRLKQLDFDGSFEYSKILEVDVSTLTAYYLSRNYPNPFNPLTTISYQIKEQRLVQLKVYDMLGREVAILVNGIKSEGSYSVDFDASNLPSGVYIYSLRANDFIQNNKMTLLK